MKSWVVIHLLELIIWLCNFLNSRSGSNRGSTLFLFLFTVTIERAPSSSGLDTASTKHGCVVTRPDSGSGGIPLFLVVVIRSEKQAFLPSGVVFNPIWFLSEVQTRVKLPSNGPRVRKRRGSRARPPGAGGEAGPVHLGEVGGACWQGGVFINFAFSTEAFGKRRRSRGQVDLSGTLPRVFYSDLDPGWIFFFFFFYKLFCVALCRCHGSSWCDFNTSNQSGLFGIIGSFTRSFPFFLFFFY